uniref:SMP-LTD domain-containing protein n=1 Tax=Steinernema glaseri TaxID=37863 RepID=A0A1I7YHD6_9BILA
MSMPEPQGRYVSDLFENSRHLVQIDIHLEEINIPEGNDLALDWADARFKLKYVFPGLEVIGEQECVGQMTSIRRIEFKHKVGASMGCAGDADIRDIWTRNTLRLRLTADDYELGVAKVDLKKLLTLPFSIADRVYFRMDATPYLMLVPYAELRIKFTSYDYPIDELLSRCSLDQSLDPATWGHARPATASHRITSSRISDGVFHPSSLRRVVEEVPQRATAPAVADYRAPQEEDAPQSDGESVVEIDMRLRRTIARLKQNLRHV